MSDAGTIGPTLAWVGLACWGVCFWWMHRISSRQDSLMKELHDVTTRIERLSKAEHELIKQVHPAVGDIKESVQEVAEAVSNGGTEQKPSK